jgi:hypothetical protein
MAVLHPQECYLLEKFVSAEHYTETRDAIIAYIDAHNCPELSTSPTDCR